MKKKKKHLRDVRAAPLPHGPPRSFNLRRTRPLQDRAHLQQRLYRAAPIRKMLARAADPKSAPKSPTPRTPRGGQSHEARPWRHTPQQLSAALRALLRREGALRAPAERNYHLQIRQAGQTAKLVTTTDRSAELVRISACHQSRDRNLPMQGIVSRSKQARSDRGVFWFKVTPACGSGPPRHFDPLVDSEL